jgi:hypothetical protein
MTLVEKLKKVFNKQPKEVEPDTHAGLRFVDPTEFEDQKEVTPKNGFITERMES